MISQRDPRWKNLILGFGTTQTIGVYGCTITCIANILGTTPDVVNERLKAVNGFSGALVIWAKLAEAFPGIKFTRVWSYDNTDVLNHVPNVLVEVPAKAIGGTDKHWVQFVGNHNCNDPWTGTERPVADFTQYGDPTSYCIVDGKWNKPSPQTIPSDTQKIIDEIRTERDNNWNLYQSELEKNNELDKQYKDEQEKNQGLREALDKQTQADADLGVQLLDAQHKATEGDNNLTAIADALSTPVDLKSILEAIDSLQKPVEEQVKPLQDHALNLQQVLEQFITPKKYKTFFDKVRIWIKKFLGI